MSASDIIAMDVIGYTRSSFTIATSSLPSSGGSTSGGGRVIAGATVTVTAAPAGGYSFVDWTEAGTQVSGTASYTFTASANRSLVANFILSAANANLSSIVPGTGGLSPAFASNVTAYSISLARTAVSFRLTPFVSQPGATVTINGTAVPTGTASGLATLVNGPNAFNVVVTAPDRVTTKTYVVTVTRASRTSPMDINGDAMDDLVFQNTAGYLALWTMDGSGRSCTTSLSVMLTLRAASSARPRCTSHAATI